MMQSLQLRKNQDLNSWKSPKRFLTSNPKTEKNVISCAIPGSMVDTYLCKSMSCFLTKKNVKNFRGFRGSSARASQPPRMPIGFLGS